MIFNKMFLSRFIFIFLLVIGLLDRNGRDPKVLDVLCSLCVNNGVAVRANQNLICENILQRRDLLLQTALVDHVAWCVKASQR